MNTELVIKVLSQINDNNIINYHNFLLDIITKINKEQNLSLLLILLLYSRSDKILNFLKLNNIDFNIIKNGKNLLFYTTILRYHDISNLLLSFGLKIQEKFIDIYINYSLHPTIMYRKDEKYYYNSYLLLKLIYNGINLIEYKHLLKDTLTLEYFDKFHKDFDEDIKKNIISYNLWNRRKNLAYIVNDKSKSRICNKYTDIFCNGLIVDNIKNYL